MENASKALIMAGAILIAILIISLGVMIYNNMARTVTRNTSLEKEEIVSFNSQLTPYVGNNISGSQVNVLIQTIFTINSKAIQESDTIRRAEITFPGYDGSESTLRDTTYTGVKKVKTGVFYNVTAEYGNNGLIDKIVVSNS